MIHIFNPEHDIALGAHVEQFTAPHAARQLRHDLGFLPMIWAEEGDKVIVEDIEAAKEAFRHLGLKAKGTWHSWHDLSSVLDARQPDEIEPWGWDKALFHRMVKVGVSPALLPMSHRLDTIRRMSHRQWAAEHVLPSMRLLPNTVGEATAVSNIRQLTALLHDHGRVVLKAPWSCSGRGIRYVDGQNHESFGIQLRNWAQNVIARQGCIMLEPYYNKVADFAMEFISDGRGTVRYCGLSVFDTRSGAYLGSVLDTEEEKTTRLGAWISPALLLMIKEQLTMVLSKRLGSSYRGSLGVDMMVVSVDNQLMVHPCVELNLRLTMGHVALALTRRLAVTPKLMSIVYTDKYRLKVEAPI